MADFVEQRFGYRVLFLVRRTVYPVSSTNMCTTTAPIIVLPASRRGVGGAIFPLALLAFISLVATRRPE